MNGKKTNKTSSSQHDKTKKSNSSSARNTNKQQQQQPNSNHKAAKSGSTKAKSNSSNKPKSGSSKAKSSSSSSSTHKSKSHSTSSKPKSPKSKSKSKTESAKTPKKNLSNKSSSSSAASRKSSPSGSGTCGKCALGQVKLPPSLKMFNLNPSKYSKKRNRIWHKGDTKTQPTVKTELLKDLTSEATLTFVDEGNVQYDAEMKPLSNEEILREFDKSTISKLANTSLDPERFLKKPKKSFQNYLDRSIDKDKLYVYILAYMEQYYDLKKDPNPSAKWRQRLDEEFWDSMAYVLPILCRQLTMKELKREGIVVTVKPECLVFGDTHGNLNDLYYIHKHIFSDKKYAHHNFVFVGDYVDRGAKSLELVLFMMCLKLVEPKRMILLRGNHEVSKVNRKYGFKTVVDTIYRHTGVNKNVLHQFIYQSIIEAFNNLPFAAVIRPKHDKGVFCCHGGIPNESYNNNKPWTIDELNKLGSYKPHDMVPKKDQNNHQSTLNELLWNDPVKEKFMEKLRKHRKKHHDSSKIPFFFNNKKRGGHCSMFTEEAANRFMHANHLRRVIRGHQYKYSIEKGYYYHFSKDQVLTVFSSSNYCGTEKNNTGMVVVTEDGHEAHTLRKFHESKHYHAFNHFQIEIDPRNQGVLKVSF